MKKLLLTLAFLLPIKTSYAEVGIGDLYFMALIAPSAAVVYFYGTSFDILEKKSRGYPIKFEEIDNCPNLQNFELNTYKNNVYTGIELPNYSKIQKVQEIDSKINFSPEQYLCINPKSNFIFKNGCLDILEKDTIKKSSGVWSVNMIFMYDEIMYVQLKNNKTKQTATTEMFNILNMLNSNLFNKKNICTHNITKKY